MRPPAADPFDVGTLTPLRAWGPSRRALLAAALAWLPLIVLAALEGRLLYPTPRASVLLDATVYARYLIAVPLLIVAESVTLPLLTAITRQFIDSGLIPETERAHHDAAVASTRRLLGNRRVRVGLVGLAYALALEQAINAPHLTGWLVSGIDEWMAPTVDGARVISLAGWWALLVSHPLFLLLTAAWLWRVLVWTRFLWKMSRLDLQLVPAHPDRAGGLFFTSVSLRAFSFVAFPLSAAFAGVIAEEVLETGRPITDYRYIALGTAATLFLVFTAPLFVFIRVLWRARLRGILEYGNLAESVGRAFEARWLHSGRPVGPEALEAEDFSATVDLYTIASNVQRMHVIPAGLGPLATLALAILAPFLLIAITSIPVDRILEVLRKILF